MHASSVPFQSHSQNIYREISALDKNMQAITLQIIFTQALAIFNSNYAKHLHLSMLCILSLFSEFNGTSCFIYTVQCMRR